MVVPGAFPRSGYVRGVSDAPEPASPALPGSDSTGASLPSREELHAKMREHTKRIEEAKDRKRQVIGLVRGAKLRVGLLESEAEGQGLEALTANLGIAMADFAMMLVINGQVVVKDAKQAAEVAKIGLDIHRALTAQEAGDVAEMTPAQRDERRKNLVAGVMTLARELKERAEAIGDDVSAAEVDAVPAGKRSEGSPSGTAPLAMVRALPPVQAEEG